MDKHQSYTLLNSQTLRRWIDAVVKEPDLFDKLQIPSRPGATNLFQSDIHGAKFEPVSRGVFSRLYTYGFGEVSPGKVDLISQRIFAALEKMNDKSPAILERALEQINHLVDRNYGLEITDVGRPGELKLRVTRDLEESELLRAFKLISPKAMKPDGECVYLGDIDRGSRIKEVEFSPRWAPEPVKINAFVNRLYGAPFAPEIRALKVSGINGAPIEIEDIGYLTETLESVERLSISHCTFKDPEQVCAVNHNLKEIYLDLPDVPLDEIAAILPSCYGAERIEVIAHSATPLQIADFLARVCPYSNDTHVSISTQEKGSFIGQDETIKIIEQTLRSHHLNPPKSLTLNI